MAAWTVASGVALMLPAPDGTPVCAFYDAGYSPPLNASRAQRQATAMNVALQARCFNNAAMYLFGISGLNIGCRIAWDVANGQFARRGQTGNGRSGYGRHHGHFYRAAHACIVHDAISLNHDAPP